ncbi:MAG TPA: zf-TFIIB domain-containing protein [Nocardioidaceae bacterium]|nr:zf-TFIIB domain-containing protein [Nocardioidaceae bacterium]
MKCPVDETVLQMTDRQGIEIDYCPQCRGVWLDRGELDKLIERSMTVAPAPQSQAPAPAYDEDRSRRPSYDDDRSRRPSYDDDRTGRPSYPPQSYDDRRRDSGYYKKRKKESFLGDLFDF